MTPQGNAQSYRRRFPSLAPGSAMTACSSPCSSPCSYRAATVQLPCCPPPCLPIGVAARCTQLHPNMG
jgi:hypothetical protein